MPQPQSQPATPTAASSGGESFPRRYARTARFTAGAPRGFAVAGDGARVVFLRSDSGTQRATSLWVLDVATGVERKVADPVDLLAGGSEQLTDAERSRRERMREGGAGITGFSVDDAGAVAAFALSSRLFVSDLPGEGGAVCELPTAGPVVDPRISPDGAQVAYVSGGALHVVGVDGVGGHPLAEPESATVSYGLAEFAAAEELDRHRGFWWAPGSDRLLVERADVDPVPVWYVSDPEHPDRAPAEHRYPVAGAANALVTLWLVDLDGARVEVGWDRAAFEYLAAVSWTSPGPPLVQVLSRRQDRSLVLSVDAASGATTVVRDLADDAWIDLVVGAPAWLGEQLVTVEVADDHYALCVDGKPAGAPGLHVRRIQVEGDRVVAHTTSGLGEDRVHAWSATDGWTELSSGPGTHGAVVGGATTVLVTARADVPMTASTVVRGDGTRVEIASHAQDPELRPSPQLSVSGPNRLPTALLLPSGWAPGGPALPVLMDPYGGPHHGLVHTAARGYLESQWWADQGFAVVVADGRGTPGSPSFERAVRYDLATAPVEDQVAALDAVAADNPGVLDLDRVAIRGWSFGGYLAALCTLQRPEVFHAAVAGAPVTQWRLYDTAYTERYLGLPEEHPEAYDRGDLVTLAPSLTRPLLVIHGLADDNVTAANSLRLSSALLAAGRPHTFLPLSGVTHMTPQEVVAENLLLLQLDFLRNALDLSA